MEFDKQNIPKHIGIIMDGNRRWAKAQGKPAIYGHKAGAKAIEDIVRYANKIGIGHITVYAFSTANWKRSEEEVKGLMSLLQSYLEDYSKKANTENIKVKILGDISAFSDKLKKSIVNCMERTKNNTGIIFNICLNYGGREEIIRAIKKISEDIKSGTLKSDDITEKLISDNLYTYGQPDPDLLIRTSGELRLSNLPDFKEEDLDNAIIEYQKRSRRYGGN